MGHLIDIAEKGFMAESEDKDLALEFLGVITALMDGLEAGVTTIDSVRADIRLLTEEIEKHDNKDS